MGHVKKAIVLELLTKETEPIALLDLLKKLGEEYSERSVRRWLSEMIVEGLVVKKGNRKGTRYWTIHQEDNESVKALHHFKAESAKAIVEVRRPLYERKPVAYQDEWIDTYRPNDTHYIPIDLQAQLQKAGERARKEDPAGTYAHQIFNRLLIDLSYNSSRLEGNTYSLLDTERLILEGTSVEGKLDEEKIMILNHKEAIRYMVDNASKLDVSEQTVCTLHYLLSDGLIEARYSGKIRDHGVRIGGSAYLPFEDKRELESRFIKLLQKAARIENPHEQSFFLLVHLSYLQGFSDVNKRTARLSANISLIKKNLVPLSFNDVNKEDYISAMIAVYELQEIRPLLDLYRFSYFRTCALYDSTVRAIGFDEIRVRYRSLRRSIIGNIIAHCLKGDDMKKYIADQSLQSVKKEDYASFIEDVTEDLSEMDGARIAGLGVTLEELNKWKHR